MRYSVRGAALAAITCLATAVVPAVATAKPKSGGSTSSKTFVVCKHGCRYTTIQSAVNASGKGATIQIKPGTYSEGVLVQGHKHDGLTIEGVGKTPSNVYLNGTNARVQGNPAQNAIEGDKVNNLTLENMKEQHYKANGFFIQNCHGYLMKNLIAGFDHAYGMYVFRCVGGRMTGSTGYGNGDSGFYIGGTPFQKKPVWSSVDHDTAYENVLGYSGTNSKYVKITNGMFYNNGAGDRPEHARIRAVRARFRRHHRQQQDLLEQLRLLPAGLAGQDRLERSRVDRRRDRQLPDRRRRPAVRDDRLEGRRTTRSSATGCGAPARSPTR